MKKFFVKQTVVVVFILTGLAVFIGLALSMGKNRATAFQAIHTYKSVFQNTRGLFKGSEVTVHGVRTGHVTQTKLLSDGRVEVSFTVLKKHTFAVNQSSVSRLETLGVLGDRYINISTPDLSAPPLKKGVSIPSQPSRNPLEWLSNENNNKEMLSAVKSLVGEVSQTLKKANQILTKIEKGEGSLGAVINNRSLYNRALTLLGGKPRHNYIKELNQRSSKKSK